MTKDVRVGVSGVGDDHTFYVRFCTRKGFGLLNEYLLVHFQQILPLHTFFPGKTANEHDHICTVEHIFSTTPTLHLEISPIPYLIQQRIITVIQF